MRQLNGNLMNKEIVDLEPNLGKLLNNCDQRKLLNENNQKIDLIKTKSNQLMKSMNEKIMNDDRLDQLLIKMEKNNENQTVAQSIVTNLTGQTNLNQLQHHLNQQHQFNFQQNFLNQHQLHQSINNGDLSIEQLNQLYYYYYPYYYLYKLNENSDKKFV